MAREKSELKSGINKAARTFTALIEAVEDLGGNDEHIRRIETDATLRGELAKLIVGQSSEGRDVYRITVDRDKRLKAMIDAGRYDWKNSDITEKHFPVEGSGSVEVDIHLVHFNRYITTEDALRELDSRGLRPAKIEELLALGAEYPDLQRKYWINALGSVWRSLLGGRDVACLDADASGRYLSLNWFVDRWRGDWRFAAVRK